MLLTLAFLLFFQNASSPPVPGSSAPPPQKPAAQASPLTGKQEATNPPKNDSDEEAALQKAIDEANGDRASLVKGFEGFLAQYPNTSRKAAVYRAIVESSQQIQDYSTALESAERFIAVRPEDTQMMMLAVGLLERNGDDQSLTRAIGYLGRVMDRVQKLTVEEKPVRLSVDDWNAQQARLLAELFLVRGRIEMEQQTYDSAEKDLDHSYELKPNAPAAEKIGEIAETKKDLPRAVEYYSLAFVLPGEGPGGPVERRDVRMKLGNTWRLLHGNDGGLGDAILAAYDKTNATPASASPKTANKQAHDAFAFTLRNLDHTAFPLAGYKGKVLVLSFWATWCGPCRELEPLFSDVMHKFSDQADVAFLAVNTDEDESRVAPFVARQKLDAPVVFADGLDDFLSVGSLPTTLVLDRAGKIVYRVDGFDRGNFVPGITAAIQKILDAKS
jgi:cytochrome c biogenesis protein CcmG/thiol:disulfide interchange protein DsbE